MTGKVPSHLAVLPPCLPCCCQLPDFIGDSAPVAFTLFHGVAFAVFSSETQARVIWICGQCQENICSQCSFQTQNLYLTLLMLLLWKGGK